MKSEFHDLIDANVPKLDAFDLLQISSPHALILSLYF